jgi:mannose-6-phosphate isomerase-like protein (cupin superfamily)
MKPYEVATIDELERIPVAEGLEWRPVRRRFGIRAFGTNAYTSERVGGWVVEEHTEGSGHEELYVVVRGRARFTLDGEEVDAPAGTFVFIRKGEVKRVARSEEPGTTVLAIGGWAGRPFEPSVWEWFFAAYGRADAGDLEEGLEVIRKGLEEHPDEPVLLYHEACLQARAGRSDAARDSLRRGVELRPELAERARQDEDLAAIANEL